jgi:endonuclease YncB( thermonuclease family)
MPRTSCTSKSARNAIRSTPASRRSSIPRDASISSAASTACSSRPARRGLRVALLFLSLYAASPTGAADVCRAGRIHETASAAYVIDGDTVILSDDRHVRLIGIDTPEIGRDGEPSEPGAELARAHLQRLLGRTSVGLVYDREKHDRHGRTLAHLFLADGRNVQAELLRAGLALPLILPPNLRYLDCYQSAAAAARAEWRGLWSNPALQPKPASRLTGEERGFQIITGRVIRVGESRSSIWLNLAPKVALRIARADLHYFTAYDPAGLRGREVEARGQVYRRDGELRMRIRHPAALTVYGYGARN